MINRLLWAVLLCGMCFGQGPQLLYHRDSRRFSFGLVEGVRFGVNVDGRDLWAADAREAAWAAENNGGGRLALRFDHPRIEWVIELTRGVDGTSALVRSEIRNTGAVAVRLGRCRLADLSDSSSRIDLASGAERSVEFVASGAQTKSYVRAVRGPKHAISRTLAQIYNPESKRTLQLAFLSFDRVHTEHEVWWDEKRAAVASSSYCDFLGFVLEPGRQVRSEELAIEIRSDPVESLEHWGDLVAARYHPPVPKTIPAGWVGYSWVDGFNVERYEDVVKRNVRAIRERLPGFDINYVWVSIGNLERNLPGNWLRWNYKNFPGGPEALVKDLAERNFRLGFWIAPFWFSGNAEQHERLEPAYLKHGGKPLIIPHRDLGATYALDPTHPATHQFLREVFSAYRQWGIRYYMLDFLNAVSGPVPGGYTYDGFYRRDLVPGPATLQSGLKVIREAAGPETYLLGSTGPTYQLIGIANGMRTGSDYGEGRPLYGPGKGFYPGTFVVNKPDFWNGHATALGAMATAFFTHRKLYLSDSGNVLTLDKPLPLPDAQIAATIFGINGGPVMLGDDIARIDPGRLEILKKEFPRLPETATPLDLFQSVDPDYAKLFRLPVKLDWGRYELVAIFNLGNDVMRQRVNLARVGVEAAHPVAVWDFWNERYLGVHSGALTVDVAPRSVVLLRLSEARNHPWLLSSDLHIRQGQAEIQDCRWDDARMELTITAVRPAGYQGSIYVRAPKGFAVADPAGLWLARDGVDSSLIVRYPVSFGTSGRDIRTIRFKRF